MDTQMFLLVLCLVVTYARAASNVPSQLRVYLQDAELATHARRVVRAAEADGYDIATLYGKSLESGESRRLSKRDVESHASHPSRESRDFELHLTSGERLHMSLQKRSVMNSETKVVEHFLNKTVPIHPQIRDCFFGGLLKEKDGHASLSLCEGQVVGAIHTSNRSFQLHPLPETVTSKLPSSADLPLRVLVTWSNATDENDKLSQEDFIDVTEDEEDIDIDIPQAVVKRSVEDKRVTIEVGVYLDQLFLERAEVKLGLISNQELTDLITRKWTGIEAVLHNPSLVGWEISIRVVSVQIWRENPEWYDDSLRTLGDRLKMICVNTMPEPFDHVSLETADTDDTALGLAYVGTVCDRRWRCSVSKGANYEHRTEIHELGHNLGLSHDKSMAQCPEGERGFMTANQNVFRPCYVGILDSTFRNPARSCLFEDNADLQSENATDTSAP